MQTKTPQWFTLGQLAKRWGKDRVTLYRWKKAGDPFPSLPESQQGKRCPRYPLAEVLAFEKANPGRVVNLRRKK